MAGNVVTVEPGVYLPGPRRRADRGPRRRHRRRAATCSSSTTRRHSDARLGGHPIDRSRRAARRRYPARWNSEPAPAPAAPRRHRRPRWARSCAPAAAGAAPPSRRRQDLKRRRPTGLADERVVGEKLTIRGKNFRRGKAKNSVLVQARPAAGAVFVKADVDDQEAHGRGARQAREVHARHRRAARCRRASACASSPRAWPARSRRVKASPYRLRARQGAALRRRRRPTGRRRLRRRRCQERRRLRRRQRPAGRHARDCSSGSTRARSTPTATASRTASSTSRRVDLNDDEYQSRTPILPTRASAVPEPAVPGDAERRLRRRRPHAQTSSRAVEVHLRGRAHRARTLTPLSYSDGKQYSRDSSPRAGYAKHTRVPRLAVPPAATAWSRCTTRAGRRRALAAGLRRSTATATTSTARGGETDRRRRCSRRADRADRDSAWSGRSPTTSATRTPTA